MAKLSYVFFTCNDYETAGRGSASVNSVVDACALFNPPLAKVFGQEAVRFNVAEGLFRVKVMAPEGQDHAQVVVQVLSDNDIPQHKYNILGTSPA